jgi:adenylate cyclase, class 2
MKSNQEIEIKLRIVNPRKLKRAIKLLGFQQLSRRVHERNTLFDFEDGSLRNAGCALRLRTAGRENLLTFKGASHPSKKYKIRREIETTIGDPGQLVAILKAIGMRPVLSYEKYRTAYSAGGGLQARPAKLAWDETAAGNYLELEGSRRWIDGIARRLGFSEKEYLTTSYVALLAKGEGGRSSAPDPPVR